jgi:regulatory protein
VPKSRPEPANVSTSAAAGAALPLCAAMECDATGGAADGTPEARVEPGQDPFPPDRSDPDRLDFDALRRELKASSKPRRGARRAAVDPTQPPPPADPYRKAMGLLVRREHSRRELTRKLATRDAEPLQVQAALDKLAGQGFQDDGRFAEMLVRSRIGGGYGPQYIRAELGMHGLAQEAIAPVLAAAEPDWPLLAREALRRRYGERPPRDRAESIKRAHFLQRRGFDLDSIRAATAAALDD